MFERHQLLFKLSPKVRKRHFLLNLEFVELALKLFAVDLLFVMLGLLTFFQRRHLFDSILALFLRFYQPLPNSLEVIDRFVALFFLTLRHPAKFFSFSAQLIHFGSLLRDICLELRTGAPGGFQKGLALLNLTT